MTQSRWLLLLSSLAVLMLCTAGMDHGKFENCNQKGFCKRLRRQTENKDEYDSLTSHYIMVSDTIQSSNRLFSAILVHHAKDKRRPQIYHDNLLLTVSVHENDIFRLRIKEGQEVVGDVKQVWEKEVPRRRSTKDVLLEKNLVPQRFLVKTADGTTRIKREHSSTELVVFHGNAEKPFQVKLVVNGADAIVFNSRSLLTVESVERMSNPPAPIQENNNTISYEGESAIGIDVAFPNTQHVYGIPERATDLSLKPSRGDGIVSEPYRMYNLDIFRYELDNKIGLYGVVPLLYGVNTQFTTAIYVLNPSETFVDISKQADGASSHWMSETGIIDVFFLPGPTPKAALKQYQHLTGTSPLPQLFSLAYHQCRWNYKDEEDVRTVDAKFDEHGIPYDVLWLDIEHLDDKKYFTWDGHYFPNPEKMIRDLAAKGRKMVTISDPHIKRAPGYYVHDDASTHGYYVKSAQGGDYEGHCWPGSSSWLDFFNPVVRNWYSSLFSFDKYKGSTETLYTWIDMNEPSVFSGPEITMHKDAKHFGDIEHREVHNQYGFYHGMATYQGHIQRRQGQDRPFILTRSFFSGSQRYIAVWTGDNEAKWEHLDKAQPMTLALSMAGIPYIGADVGGFFDNPETELLVRWYQAGAFLPFFRAHAHIETQRREPWLFGDDNTALIRNAIKRRYRILPYYYTLAYYSATSGLPLIRPMFYEYPTDAETYDMQNQFLLGESLLIKPVVTKGSHSVEVFLPGDQPWYHFEDGDKVSASNKRATVYTPLDYIPLFQKGGSIIPLKFRVRRSSAQMVDDPITLQVALDTAGKAQGEIYFDDGQSFKYQQGEYVLQGFTFENNQLSSHGGNTTSNLVKPNGTFKVANVIERIIVLGKSHAPSKVTISGLQSIQDVHVTPMLEFEYDRTFKKVTIKNVNIPLTGTWTIKLE